MFARLARLIRPARRPMINGWPPVQRSLSSVESAAELRYAEFAWQTGAPLPECRVTDMRPDWQRYFPV